ncbi:MAG: hypothetical protein HDT43_04610 [Ruminococcaceae bacterium]|nr:hypothetical protein [Oscillospiraceae bacterium]
MKQLFCVQCGEVLSKGKTCNKCGYDNPELFPLLHKHTRFKKTIKTLGIIVVLVVLVCVFVEFLSKHPYLWHYQAGRNRIAILEYAKENYPEAEIVEEYYPSAKFSPTNKPYDTIVFDFNDLKFFIRARDGKVNEKSDDGYGAAIMRREIREKYLDDFFRQIDLPYNVQIYFADQWPQKYDVLDSYKGSIQLEFESEYDDSKTPQDFDWFYDFYCYWRDICPTRGFTLRFYYWTANQEKYLIYCDSGSEFDSKEEFYSASKRLPV